MSKQRSNRPIEPSVVVSDLEKVPPYQMPQSHYASDLAYTDRRRGWVVQVWKNEAGCKGTPWEGAMRVSVKHTAARNLAQFEDPKSSLPITWDDLQAIKDHFWPECIAIEVYPPKSAIVNVADMRWLWVLPAGAMLPFNLQADSQTLLKS